MINRTNDRSRTAGDVYRESLKTIRLTAVFLACCAIAAGARSGTWINVTAYPLPKTDSVYEIAAGPDGALWFAEFESNEIGRMTTAGVITKYPVPTLNSGLGWITAGPDGALWFTEGIANKIGRITITGAITEYPVPTPNSGPRGMRSRPRCRRWRNRSPASQDTSVFFRPQTYVWLSTLRSRSSNG